MSTNHVTAYVELIRPYNAVIALLSFSLGYFYPSPHKRWSDYCYALMLLLLLHSIATIHNDIHDYAIDRINDKQKSLTSHSVTISHAKIFMDILLGILIVLCFFSLSHFLFISLLGGGSVLYNKFFSRMPFLSIISIGLLYSAIPMLYGFSRNTSLRFLPVSFVFFVLGFFLIRMGISMLKDFKDARGDAQFHKKTFFLTFGYRQTVVTSLVLTICGYFVIFCHAWYYLHAHALLIFPLLFALHACMPRISLQKAKNLSLANTLFHRIALRENRFEGIFLLWLIYFR